MQQNIIESNIFFISICFLQYEDLIKLFNYQYYAYLKDDDDLNSSISDIFQFSDESRFVLLNYDEINKIPTDVYNNSLISEENMKLYIYFYGDNYSHDRLIKLIKASYLTFLNQMKDIGYLKIPFYGNITIIKDYVITFNKYKAIITLNYTKL